MDYDLIIIGAGWAGFNAALKGKELGLKVALVEKDKIGGTCLNYGCIPTKSLIQSAKTYSLIQKSTAKGSLAHPAKLEFALAQARKDKLVQQLQHGMKFMLRGIDFLQEEALIQSPDIVKAGQRKLKTRFILISSGSKTLELPNLKVDGKKIISSNEALALQELPSSILIIGGGAIGCEFASLFSMLGVRVAIVEKMPQLLPGVDKDIAQKIEGIFKKNGIKVMINSDALDPATGINDYDKSLLCVGRIANTRGLGLGQLGIALEKERIAVDACLKTNIDNIYAAGDCASKTMLAHFAAYEGELAVTNMASPVLKKADNKNIPSCVYCHPEIASVGMDTESAARQGLDVRVHRFDFMGSGMAHILEETEGFIKVVSDKKSGQVLGAAIIGPRATELIGIMTLAVSSCLKVSQIRDIVFAHPSLSESLSEALKDSHEIQGF